MPSLEEFKKILQNKRYLFHFHTTYTDGKIDIKDYFMWAKRNQVEVLIFCEHIRKETTYSLIDFEREVSFYSENYGIPYILGVETKLIPGGFLDINESDLEKVDLIGWGCHSFPKDLELYISSVSKLFEVISKKKEKIWIWVHPGRFLKKKGFLHNNHKTLSSLIRLAEKYNVFIEKNLRDSLPPNPLWEKVNNVLRIIGVDAHNEDDLNEYENYLVYKRVRW